MSRMRQLRWWITGGLVLVSVATLLWWLATRETEAERQIVEELASLRAAGEPVDAEGLARLFPNPPPSADAHLLLTNILRFAQDNRLPASSPFVSSAKLDRISPLADYLAADLRAYHERTKSIWAEWPAPWPTGVVFASHWERGMTNNTPPKFIQVRMLAQMLASLAIVAAEDGDAERATQMLERGFQLAHAMPSDSLVMHMIGRAVVGLNLTAAERCLNRVQFTDEHLRRLDAVLIKPGTNHFANALRGEHCIVIWAFQSVQAGHNIENILGGTSGGRWLERLWKKFKDRTPAYTDADFLRYLRFYRASLDVLKLPPPQAIAESRKLLDTVGSNATSRVGKAVPAEWGKSLQADFELQARRDALKTALAIEQYRIQKRNLPEAPAQLSPGFLTSVPSDLFDGQPLRFKKLASGYTVYSVGVDGRDDDGVERGTNSTNYDLPITVER